MESQNKIRLTQRFWAKAVAFALVIVMLAVAAASTVAAFVIVSENIYIIPEEEYRNNTYENLSQNIASNIVYFIDEGYFEDAASYCNDSEVLYAEVYNEEDVLVWQSAFDKNHGNNKMQFDYDHGDYSYRVVLTLTDDFEKSGEFYLADILITLAYALRFWIYVIIVVAVIIAITCFVFLMCASGRRVGYAEPQPGWGTKIPLDILAGICIFCDAVLCFACDACYDELLQFIMVIATVIFIAVSALGFFMSVALRFKLGKWWENTFIWWALSKLCRIVSFLWQGVKGLCKLVSKIPLIWKTVLLIVVISLMELFVIVVNIYDAEIIAIFWILEKMVLIPQVLYVALCLKKLQLGGKEIAGGNLGYKIDTSKMVLDFKKHGENLNEIGKGINIAVEQRLKSEHMKTELITNVSHDIKTPLTSIINYADLIGREPCENERVTEYADVLLRQSQRLKHLIEDLVEASKASTGNLDVNLAPFDVGVMLTQAAGEYEQKLGDRNLVLVTNQPEAPVRIMADGRRLWRVFDNLMNNIYKYSQSGTRVYLTLKDQQGFAEISFKNISKDALNMSADELMERFTRGDSSRNSEGNGLGLSIAKSLVELNNGTMEILTDGDLFKVVLKFPVI